jgi:hypothetical protein
MSRAGALDFTETSRALHHHFTMALDDALMFKPALLLLETAIAFPNDPNSP